MQKPAESNIKQGMSSIPVLKRERTQPDRFYSICIVQHSFFFSSVRGLHEDENQSYRSEILFYACTISPPKCSQCLIKSVYIRAFRDSYTRCRTLRHTLRKHLVCVCMLVLSLVVLQMTVFTTSSSVSWCTKIAVSSVILPWSLHRDCWCSSVHAHCTVAFISCWNAEIPVFPRRASVLRSDYWPHNWIFGACIKSPSFWYTYLCWMFVSNLPN